MLNYINDLDSTQRLNSPLSTQIPELIPPNEVAWPLLGTAGGNQECDPNLAGIPYPHIARVENRAGVTFSTSAVSLPRLTATGLALR